MVAETSEHLKHIVNEFERACESMGLEINVEKSKVYVVKRTKGGVVRR